MRKYFLQFNSFALTAICLMLFTCPANAAPKKVVLNWTAPVAQSGITLTGYKVYRGTIAGGEGTTAFATVSGPVTTFTDTTVNPGTTYFYFVSATGTCDPVVWDCSTFSPESGPSNEVTSGKIPLPAAPVMGAPTAATATVQ